VLPAFWSWDAGSTLLSRRRATSPRPATPFAGAVFDVLGRLLAGSGLLAADGATKGAKVLTSSHF
jgi:hypothetical protein